MTERAIAQRRCRSQGSRFTSIKAIFRKPKPSGGHSIASGRVQRQCRGPGGRGGRTSRRGGGIGGRKRGGWADASVIGQTKVATSAAGIHRRSSKVIIRRC
jgi:hypothetical protein